MIKVDVHAPSSILGMDKQHVDLTQAQQSLQNLFDKNVQGSEWLGWLDTLLLESNKEELASIQRKAAQLQSISDFISLNSRLIVRMDAHQVTHHSRCDHIESKKCTY